MKRLFALRQALAIRTTKDQTMLEPQQDAFEARYDKSEPCLVSTRLVADLETPVSAFLKLSASRAGNIFLLESVEGGAARGRYSMIGLDPDLIWRTVAGKAEINRNALTHAQSFRSEEHTSELQSH